MTLEKKIKNSLINNELFKNISSKICNAFTKNLEFSWETHSWAVAKYCPEYLDSKKYNWNAYTHYVLKHCPEKLDINKANIKNIINTFKKYKKMSLEQIKQHAILNKL